MYDQILFHISKNPIFKESMQIFQILNYLPGCDCLSPVCLKPILYIRKYITYEKTLFYVLYERILYFKKC